MRPSCLKVDKAMIFFISLSKKAESLAIVIVKHPIKNKYLFIGHSSK